MCTAAASRSKDRSTKVGCIIVGPENEIRTVGYNGFIRGADDDNPKWHVRPMKYKVTAHAEINAIANAARNGTPLKGCTAYISFPPCAQCTVALVQVGIRKIKVLNADPKQAKNKKWLEEFEITKEILSQANVKMTILNS
jgi:dCMP deaminase